MPSACILSLIYLYCFQKAVEALIFLDFDAFYACLVLAVFILCNTYIFIAVCLPLPSISLKKVKNKNTA